MKKASAILAVVFPMLLMIGWLTSLYIDRYRGTAVELKITGYDPRDILSGHYFTYRLDFSPEKVCDKNPGQSDYCVCLEPSSSGPAQVLWHGQCESKVESQCHVFIKGDCKWNGFIAGVERFYISDTYKIQTVPPGTTVKLSVKPSGSAQVTNLLVDGKPLAEVMKEKR